MDVRDQDQENYPIVRTLSEAQPVPLVDNAGGGVQYLGYAALGVRESEAKWKILKVSVTGTVTKTEYAS